MKKNGYKESQLCMIPAEWDNAVLASVCLMTQQINPTSNPTSIFEYIDVSSVSNQSFKIVETTPTSGATASSRARKLVRVNDVIYATIRPSLKRIALVPVELDGSICSTAFCVIRANPDLAVPKFLYHVLLSDRITEKIASLESGSSYPAVTDKQVLSQSIPLPPLSEQRSIAAILSKIQDAIQVQEKIIDATKSLKKSLMAKLFTEGTRGEELKKTEIGMMPKSWEISPLGELAEIVYGAQAAVAHATDSSIGTPILTNINITNEGKLDLSTLRYYRVPDTKKRRLILKKGDILFNWRSGSKEHVGKTAIFNEDGEFTFSSFILRFRVNDRAKNTYLFYWLQQIKLNGYFSQFRQQSSVNSVFNASASAKIPIGVPSAAEQDEVAAALTTVDAKLEVAVLKHSVLKKVFDSALHELMTGKIRVNGMRL